MLILPAIFDFIDLKRPGWQAKLAQIDDFEE